jgi:hypothetical protein
MKTPTSYRGPDGRWIHNFRQSFLNDVRMCPEMARRKLLGLVEDETGDAALVGTAIHTGIEAFLLGEANSLDEVLAQGYETWWSERDNLSEPWRIIKDDAEAEDCIGKTLNRWWAEVLEQLPQEELLIEQRFSHMVLSDDTRDIYIEGTKDVEYSGGVIDWKTTMRTYKRNEWKHQRYDVQPTIYLWSHLLNYGSLGTFRYWRLPRNGGECEHLDITRRLGDFRAMEVEMINLATLIEAELPAWPLNPSDWWCSEKWCPTFAAGECRGAHVSINPEFATTERMLEF